ncbi:Ion transport protein-domain-containing protein [Syncephalis plumigaleata]|nr:Ion transport protein-domain-containing protein [Syncephalis plumigaleata]
MSTTEHGAATQPQARISHMAERPTRRHLHHASITDAEDAEIVVTAGMEVERARAREVLVASINPNSIDEHDYQQFVRRWRTIHERKPSRLSTRSSTRQDTTMGHFNNPSAVQRSSAAAAAARRARSSNGSMASRFRDSGRLSRRTTLRESIMDSLRDISARVAGSQGDDHTVFSAVTAEAQQQQQQQQQAHPLNGGRRGRRSRRWYERDAALSTETLLAYDAISNVSPSSANAYAMNPASPLSSRTFMPSTVTDTDHNYNEFTTEDVAEQRTEPSRVHRRMVSRGSRLNANNQENPIDLYDVAVADNSPPIGQATLDDHGSNSDNNNNNVAMNVSRGRNRLNEDSMVNDDGDTSYARFSRDYIASRMPVMTTPGGGTRISFTRSDRSRRPSALAFNNNMYKDPHRPPLGGRSFGILGPDNELRVWLARCLQNRWIEPFILLLVLINCLLLAFDIKKFNEKEEFGDSWLDFTMLAIFTIYTIEVVVKMIVFGVIVNPPPIQRHNLSNTGGRGKTRRSNENEQQEEGLTKLSIDTGVRASKSNTTALSAGQHQLRRRDSSRCRYNEEDENDDSATSQQHYKRQLTNHGNKSAKCMDIDDNYAGISPFPSPAASAAPSPIHSDIKPASYSKTEFDPLKPATITTAAAAATTTTPLPPKRSLGWWLPFRMTRSNSTSTPPLPNAPIDGYTNGSPIKPILPHTAYLRHTFNQFPLFKGLAALRSVRLLVITSGLATIMQSLKVAMPLLVDVTGFIMFFLLLFGIIALETFKGSLSRRCEMFDDNGNDIVTAPIKYCGSYWNDKHQKANMCRDTDNNPFFGYLGYDHIFLATLTIIASVRQKVGQTRSLAAKAAASRMELEEAWMMAEEGRRPTLRQRIHAAVAKLVDHPVFTYFGGALAAANLGIMATRTQRSSPRQLLMISRSEISFTAVFAAEIILRIYAAPSWSIFWTRAVNRVDLFLAVATSIIQFTPINSLGWYRYLTVLHVMRFYRVVPLIPRINVMAAKIFKSTRAFFNVIFFLIMTLLVTSTVTMQVFSGSFTFEDDNDKPRLNFDTFGDAFLSLFVVLTGENWNVLLYDYVIANLFVAVLLENFELDEEEKRARQIVNFLAKREQREQYISGGLFSKLNPYLYMKPKPRLLQVSNLPKGMLAQVRKSMVRRMLSDGGVVTDDTSSKVAKSHPGDGSLWSSIRRRIRGDTTDIAMEEMNTEMSRTYPNTTTATTTIATTSGGKYSHSRQASKRGRHESGFASQFSGITAINEGDDMDEIHLSNMDDATTSQQQQQRQQHGNIPVAHTDAPGLTKKAPQRARSGSRLRRWCQSLVGTRETRAAGIRTWFDWFIILSIIGSIVVVVMDTPVLRQRLYREEKRDSIYPKLDVIFVVIFTIELFVRACADGFLFTPDAYLRDAWNRMDFIVLLTLAAGFCVEATAAQGPARTFRATRAIRPLRLINQFRGTREIFFSTISTVPSILYTASLSLLFVIPFAVYGVNVFAGYFAQCNDDNVANVSECQGEFLSSPPDTDIAILMPRVWSNPYQYSFDSFGSAILLLFEMASGEGWVDVLFTGMSVPHSVGEQMHYTNSDPSWYNSIFFSVYMLFGSVVVVQLFIGVIVENLKTRSGIALLTVDQRRWIDLQRQLKMIRPTTRPQRPAGRLRAWCFDLAIEKNGRLARFINVITVFNLLIMMTEHKGQPTLWEKTKVIIKLYGLGFKKWRKNRWNIFDLVVISGALITIFADIVVQVQKLFLVAIAFKLVQQIESLQMLFKTLMASVPSIINIMTVLLLVFIVYAILFMEIFGLTRLGRYTNTHANFREFDNTLLLLLRMTTGENWNYVMHDMMLEAPNCVSAANYLNTDCGSRYWALFLFISFYVIGTYILVNMFIVVVIDNFSYTYQRDIRAAYVTRADLRGFKRVWADFDPKATGYIPVRVLPAFLRALTGRFSVRIYDDTHDVVNLRRRAIKGQRGPGGGETFTADAVHVDIHRLNRTLAAMNVAQVRTRRRRYNLVYQEALLVQDSRGISFHAMLQVLAYSLVETDKCLQVEDLIIRQRKEEELLERAAREKVAGILRTLIQRRRFRQLVRQAMGQARGDGSFSPVTTPGTGQLGKWGQGQQGTSRSSNFDTGRARPMSGTSFLSADEGDPASDSDTANNHVANTTPDIATANHSPDAWSNIASTEMITAENADSVLRNVTSNMWYGIMEEEREREAVADLTSLVHDPH